MNPSKDYKMNKTIISTDQAPAAIGPYSQGVKVGKTIYLSGQIPLLPKTGEMVEGGIEEQTRHVMDNIQAILKSLQLSMENVVKTTIFLVDLNQFGTVNEIYGSYFKTDPPARSTIQVAALPKGALVEIESIVEV